MMEASIRMTGMRFVSPEALVAIELRRRDVGVIKPGSSPAKCNPLLPCGTAGRWSRLICGRMARASGVSVVVMVPGPVATAHLLTMKTRCL